MADKAFRIAIAGLGTVGAGVVKLLQDNRDIIAERAGQPVEIVAVAARDRHKNRGVDFSHYKWLDDPLALIEEKPDAIVELIGGADGPARALIEKALDGGVSVVTANKALLAHHGHELALLAEKTGAALMWEAAVAGGIPAIKTLREGLAANRISGVYGILNGTCNYILTQMRETGTDFASVLNEAQEKGYAEADPSFDIDGTDAGHKICLLAALAFGVRPDFPALRLAGIRNITASDIAFAGELGYRIKLLGIARNDRDGIAAGVEPCLVGADSALAAVSGVTNAVFIESDFAGPSLLTGRGAGGGPTASAVVADIIDLARGHKGPAFGIPARELKPARALDAGETRAPFYLRLNVLDRAGVLAEVAAILRDHDISIESLLQRGRDPDQPVPVVITTHEARRDNAEHAAREIGALEASAAPPCLMWIVEGL